MEGPDLFESEIPKFVEHFPKFHKAISSQGTVMVEGELEIVDQDGKLWETYQVEIHSCDGFPHRFPYVFETGGKIPRIGDWHVYEDTQSCCLAVEPEERLICKDGLSLIDFVKNNVLPYFFNQTFRKVEGYYKNGEYAHGLRGIYEFYDDVLKTKGDIRETIRLMIKIAHRDKPGRTHNCFCGSNTKFRRCHRDAYKKLSKLDKEILYIHAEKFSKMISQ